MGTKDEERLDRSKWVHPASVPLLFLGEETYACPRQTLLENPFYWNVLWRYYGMYKKGFLPQVGAVMDQTNRSIALFQQVDAVIEECNEAENPEPPPRESRPKGDPFV